MKKISVITCTYNSEAYLRECIESVLSQAYINLEYIVVDGGSTDSTIEIIKSYGNRISHWLTEPDKGIYDAINKGIRLASGDLVGILNSDDYLADSNVIGRVAEAFDKSNAKVVFADIDFVDNATRKVVRHYSSRFFRPWMFRFGFQPAHPTFYTYRSYFKSIGYYRTDLKIAGDFELLLRFLLTKRLPYSYINDTWVKMRMGGVSTSGIRSVLRLNREIKDACRSNGLYVNDLMIYSKYLVKWWGFIRKKK